MSSFVTISEAASLALHASTYIAHNPDKKKGPAADLCWQKRHTTLVCTTYMYVLMAK